MTNPALAYSVPEACSIACAGRTALYEALRRGELPHIRIGRKILIPEDAFDLMLANQHSNATSPRSHPRGMA